MNIWGQWTELVTDWTPAGLTLVVVLAALLIVRLILNRRFSSDFGFQFRNQLILLLLTLIGVILVLMALPVSEATRGQLLSLIGILLSATIALSATTFLGNIMAGLMQRTVRNFLPGDFIRVGDTFGRVSEQGLFHVEIQTEDRDLTTVPNLHLVTGPVKVIRTSGSLVSARVSLGYEVPRTRVRELLLAAAASADLEEPFVHVLELGDFSVTYRVSGLLKDVKNLLSTRSILREQMLDHLHEGGVEIVSPTFMNQRALPADRVMIPSGERPAGYEVPNPFETIAFDKADEAESIEKLRDRHRQMEEQIKFLKKEIKAGSEPDQGETLKARLQRQEESLQRLQEFIEKRRAEAEQKDR